MRSQTGISRQDRAMRNSIVRNDAIYQGREDQQRAFASKLTPAQKGRNAGEVTINGHTVYRQAPLTRVLFGNRTAVSFTIDLSMKGRWAIIDADDLQPSHLGGAINPLHFIPEAQPRNRALSQSGANTPDRIARNLRPEEIMLGSTAYTGAPVVNDRGEVIQGNGRAYAIKAYYQISPNDPKEYVPTLISTSTNYGLLLLEGVLAAARIDKPVLVRMLDVSDNQAIELGQYGQNDTEAVTTNAQKSKAKARLMTPAVTKKVVNELLHYDSSDATLTELIRASNVLKVLIREGVIRTDDLENYTKNGSINEAGVTFVTDLLINALFAESDTNVPDVFSQSPQAVQNIVKKSALFLLRSPSRSRSIGREIGNAIYAYRDFNSSGIGQFQSWLRQFDLNGQTPLDRYANLELRIAELFSENATQRSVIDVFRRYGELVTGRAADMFSSAQPGMTKSQAVKTVFGVKVYPDVRILKSVRTKRTVLQQTKSAQRTGAALRTTHHQGGATLSAHSKAVQAKAKMKMLLYQF